MIGLANWWHQFHEIWGVIKVYWFYLYLHLSAGFKSFVIYLFLGRYNSVVVFQYLSCIQFFVTPDDSMPGSCVLYYLRSLLKFRYNLHGVKCINSTGQWVGQMHTPMSSTPLSRCQSSHYVQRVLSCPLPVNPHSFLSDFYHCSLVLPVWNSI